MLSKMRSRAQGSEGFTLIELMIVVAIIGILAAVGVPQFVSYRDKARHTNLVVTGGSARAALAAIAAEAPDNLYPSAVTIDNLNTNGAKIPTTNTTLAYTQVNSGQDYTLTLYNTVVSKGVCVTPDSVLRGNC